MLCSITITAWHNESTHGFGEKERGVENRIPLYFWSYLEILKTESHKPSVNSFFIVKLCISVT